MRGTASAIAGFLFLMPWAAGAEEQVSVQVEVVRVSNQGTEVSPPELVKMKEAFQRQNLAFSSFKRLSRERVELRRGNAAKVTLPNSTHATLQLIELQEGSATVRIDVPRLTAADVKLGRQGSVYQLAGEHTGGKLVLVLSRPDGNSR